MLLCRLILTVGFHLYMYDGDGDDEDNCVLVGRKMYHCLLQHIAHCFQMSYNLRSV